MQKLIIRIKAIIISLLIVLYIPFAVLRGIRGIFNPKYYNIKEELSLCIVLLWFCYSAFIHGKDQKGMF